MLDAIYEAPGTPKNKAYRQSVGACRRESDMDWDGDKGVSYGVLENPVACANKCNIDSECIAYMSSIDGYC